jgi:hypothetical protein
MAHITSKNSKQIFTQMGMDHGVHAASIIKVLTEGIAETLKNRTGTVAMVGPMRISKTQDGTKYTVSIRHEISPDLQKTKQTKVRLAQESVCSSLSSKAGVLSVLASKGIS